MPKALIVTLGRGLGFAFSLIDLTPSERMIWEASNTPAGHSTGDSPVAAGARPYGQPAGYSPERQLAPRRHRRAPTGYCLAHRPGTRRTPQLSSARISPGRPAQRRNLTRRTSTVPTARSRPATPRKSASCASAGGSVYQANLGVVRFEFDGDDLVACHDLIHPPNKHQAASMMSDRVPLSLFEDERPRLKYEPPVEV